MKKTYRKSLRSSLYVVKAGMRERINKAINHLDLELAGGGKDGVFYFVQVSSNTALDSEAVYVSNMKHLTIKQWLEEANWAVRQNKSNTSWN